MQDDLLDLRRIEKDERVRRLVEAIESDGRECAPEASEPNFVPQFPASGSKNW